MRNSTTVEDRIQRLEDIDSIKKLTATYGLYVNKGWNGEVVDFDKLPNVLSEDATWHSAETAVTGRDDIVEMLKKITANGRFAMHSFTNPIIDIDGDMARGNWLLWVGVNTEDESANQVYLSEDLEYVRTPDGWLISAITLHFGQLLLQG